MGTQQSGAARSDVRDVLETSYERLRGQFSQLFMIPGWQESPEGRQAFHDLAGRLHARLLLEEELMLPAYELEAAAEASRIRSSHNRLRSQLELLTTELELCATSPEAVDSLLAQLREGTSEKTRILHPWVDAYLPQRSKLRLLDRLSRLEDAPRLLSQPAPAQARGRAPRVARSADR